MESNNGCISTTVGQFHQFVNFIWKFRVIPLTVTYHLSYAKLLSSWLYFGIHLIYCFA